MRNGPICDCVEAFVSQGIDSAVFPGKGWRSNLRLTHRNMLGTAGQWVAVVEMAGEVEATLHRMNHSDHGPRRAIQTEPDVSIPRLMSQ